jgi:hypothetical protein
MKLAKSSTVVAGLGLAFGAGVVYAVVCNTFLLHLSISTAIGRIMLTEGHVRRKKALHQKARPERGELEYRTSRES